MLANASECVGMKRLQHILGALEGISVPTFIEWVGASLLACFRERVLVVVLLFFGVGLRTYPIPNYSILVYFDSFNFTM